MTHTEIQLSIQDAVIKAFVRLIKDCGKMHMLNAYMCDNLHIYTYKQICNIINKEADKLSTCRPRMPKPMGEISDLTNAILHHFIEPNIQRFKIDQPLDELGREIFDLSYYLYTGHEVEVPKQMQQPPIINDVDLNELLNELLDIKISPKI